MDDKMVNTRTGSFGKGLILGGVVGATLALLYAPKTGAKLRNDVRKKVSGLQRDLNRHTLRLKNQAKTLSGTNGATHNRRIHA